MAMETLMGRHPGDLLSLLSSSSSQHTKLQDILDPRLSPPIKPRVAQNVALVATLALACVDTDPRSRPTMQLVSEQLLSHRSPLPHPFHEISIGELKNQEIYLVCRKQERSIEVMSAR